MAAKNIIHPYDHIMPIERNCPIRGIYAASMCCRGIRGVVEFELLFVSPCSSMQTPQSQTSLQLYADVNATSRKTTDERLRSRSLLHVVDSARACPASWLDSRSLATSFHTYFCRQIGHCAPCPTAEYQLNDRPRNNLSGWPFCCTSRSCTTCSCFNMRFVVELHAEPSHVDITDSWPSNTASNSLVPNAS